MLRAMTTQPPPRLALANLPTPLFHSHALDALVGAEVWVKRDDMTAGAETGNKIRKLEFLLADAQRAGADVVVTCGGLQSNHCRATALLARGLGMRCVLFLRGEEPALREATGNYFLNRLAGAEIHAISATDYAMRDTLMAKAAEELSQEGATPYVIPEGGSNGLGAFGYVHACAELKSQLDAGDAGGEAFEAIAVACGSGGTAAGLALGAKRNDVATQVLAMAVCDSRAYFERRVADIMFEARKWAPGLSRGGDAELVVLDEFKGPAYGMATEAQLEFLVAVARVSGLVLDPVYSGKALYALAHMKDRPSRVCFVHTGGCPGLLAEPGTLTRQLQPERQ